MKIKITAILLCLLFIGTTCSQLVCAGDEADPELIDDERDVRMWFLFKGPFVNILFKSIDILSCWIYEKPEEPDNFFITIQMRSLHFGYFNTTYTMLWECNNNSGYAFFGHKLKNEQFYAIVGYREHFTDYRYETNASVDIEKKTVTITVPKKYVGNLSVGDVLENPLCGATLRPNKEALSYRFPFLSLFAYDEVLNGRNYTIQY